MEGQVIWFFGRPCAGKTSLANSVKNEMLARGVKTISFDGDELRKGINKDLGFSIADRQENIRRAAELAALFARKGYWVVCSFVTPTKEIREMVDQIIGRALLMVFVSTPLEVCMARDTKGHYKRAQAGELANFTGITSPFEEPLHIALSIDCGKFSLEEATQVCSDHLLKLTD
ncbi:adenylyl-sulfate kinase [Sunxiuqinia sp. sy24]|uniref:adenylyl-sulfate kinase n=1 Tax=Sunxiuqinia sp. sy24 TaxID=3461495 RepID=UPI0040465446